MLKKSIYVNSKCIIFYKTGKLLFHKKHEKRIKAFPLIHIESLILDNKHITITEKALSALMSHFVPIILCNHKHLPVGSFLSINSYNKLNILRLQLRASKRLKGRLWRRIIKRKILNQLITLQKLNRNKQVIKKLKINYKSVTSYDRTKREAYSASLYFIALFGNKFVRQQHNTKNQSFINSCLNYAYTLINNNIARRLIEDSFEPIIGIWHKGPLNQFNLASDLIEPFRGIVDYYICLKLLMKQHKYLHQSDINEILGLLNAKIYIEGKYWNINDAINIEVDSFKRCLEKQSSNYLIMPKNKIKGVI